MESIFTQEDFLNEKEISQSGSIYSSEIIYAAAVSVSTQKSITEMYSMALYPNSIIAIWPEHAPDRIIGVRWKQLEPFFEVQEDGTEKFGFRIHGAGKN